MLHYSSEYEKTLSIEWGGILTFATWPSSLSSHPSPLVVGSYFCIQASSLPSQPSLLPFWPHLCHFDLYLCHSRLTSASQPHLCTAASPLPSYLSPNLAFGSLPLSPQVLPGFGGRGQMRKVIKRVASLSHQCRDFRECFSFT